MRVLPQCEKGQTLRAELVPTLLMNGYPQSLLVPVHSYVMYVHLVYLDMVPIVFFLCKGSGGDTELSQFLEARNPRNDHSLTLPSLLAKPIVVSHYVAVDRQADRETD